MSIWQELIGNLAVVALSVFGWEALNQRIERASVAKRHFAFACVMGISAVISMILAVHLPDGVIVDLRASIIAVSGFFGGPFAGLVTGLIAGGYRVLSGGEGMGAGLVVIGLAASAGVVGHLLAHRHPEALSQVLLLAVAATFAKFFGILTLPPEMASTALHVAAVPVLGLTFVSTLISGMIILQGRRISDERRLLMAALHQSPEFQYVKDRQSRFVIVNQHAADYHGYEKPEMLRGKSDFDISDHRTACQLYDQEQKLLSTGLPVRHFINTKLDGRGELHWFSTSKSAVIGREGDVIGLVGVTHEITQQKRTEADLTQSRNLLSAALAGMSDGLAMFDANDVMMFCNQKYLEMFPLTAHLRRPGVSIRTILEGALDLGEHIGAPNGDAGREAWIQSIVDSLHTETERELNLSNGRWLRIRTRLSEDGMSTVTVTDITQSKLAQDALLTLTDQLKALAGTDALTGLTNRRAFDQSLTEELARTRDDCEPLSLLMIDVDHFKAYNDIYGHLAGDECLKVIGKCLKRIARSPREIASRFGGEEFAMILPGVDADNADEIAQEIRDVLEEECITHAGNDHGTVTVSIGVATIPRLAFRRVAADLVSHADEALYEAKRLGRNRTITWIDREKADSSAA